MKRFSFKLNRVLKLKKLKETIKKRELGMELKSLNDKEDALQESIDIKEHFNKDFNEVKRVGVLDPITFRRYGSYMGVLSAAIEKTTEERKDQRLKVDQARLDVKSAVDQTKIFNKLHDIEHQKYIMEADKEMEKELSEMAIARFRRQQTESGSALNVIMAIAASTFAAILLLCGLLFATGTLTPAKIKMITNIIRYDYKKYNEDKKVLNDNKALTETRQLTLFGAEDPYILDFDVYKKLKESQEELKKIKIAAQDQTSVSTKDVLDQRSEILRRMGEALKNTKADIDNSVKKLDKGDAALAKREDRLKEEKKKFHDLTSSKKAQEFEQAQKDILKSFASMDPESIVKIITNEKEITDLKEPYKKKAIAYAASYVSKLKTRKRAGVMESLSSDWAMAVNNFLEGDRPL